MNSNERTDHLYKKAKLKGWDAPNDSMISEAIHDAEQEAVQDILSALDQAGRFSAALKYLEDRYQYIQSANEEEQYYDSLPDVADGVETDFTGLPMNPFDPASWKSK